VPASERAAATTTTRSKVVVTSPPHLIDDEEFFIPELGRGNRRALRTGEHVAVDHPLAVAYPGHFEDSNEPPDAWAVPVLTAEARKRQQAAQMRLASHPARLVRPCCARCGAFSDDAVVMHDQPSVLGLTNALSALDEGDPDSWAETWRIETTFARAAKAFKEQEAELQRVEAEWRASHQQCPEGTPPIDEPTIPDNVPLQWRLPGVRTAG
jgi:hypothetical protein